MAVEVKTGEPLGTMNRFGVSAGSRGVVMLLPCQGPLTNEEAINLSAWLFVMATMADERITVGDWEKLVNQIRLT